MKEKNFHNPLFKAVPQTCLRYAMGASVKGRRFHTPLFKAVPQNYLRYAMGASVKGSAFTLHYLRQYRRPVCGMQWEQV
ncbi:hypothetical protein [Anaerocolumna jejuensis]|uniref:hypothetical protein n=1 Tax=Anaerocolumna jejuensis TaxID=259063 RepID=UPI00093403D0|nr:hypothetical protein [Anaerocolumna jejuensis]